MSTINETMNTDIKICEPSMIKEVLCKHFGVHSESSVLKTSEKHFFGLGGHQIHYYYFTLRQNGVVRRAFGKSAANNEREYNALKHLMKVVPEEQRNIGRPIALLGSGEQSLLLLEYLEGYSNALTIGNSLRLYPNRTLNISRLGKDVLDKLYGLHDRSLVSHRLISPRDTERTPGQPRPIGVLKQLESLRSLSQETKQAVSARIDAIIKNETNARRGIVHGALGMRNVMIGDGKIAFIDWEFMEDDGLCIYDACYVATMLLMKAIQIFVSTTQLDKIHDALYDHIEYLEESLTDASNRKFIKDCIWFGRCIALVDTLWQYENSEGGQLRSVIAREERKVKYLAYRIEQDLKSVEDAANAKGRRSHWTDYVKDSKRGSSSADATAENFIEMGGVHKGTRIADLGCGHGRITELLVSRVPSLDIVGVDMTQHLLDNFSVKAGDHGCKLELIQGDVTKLPLDDCDFDVAVSSRVFQYLPNPLLAVREAMRILKPGGVLVVSVPNKLNPIRFFNYKHKLYSPFEARDWLKACGFEDIEYGSICFFPSSVSWKRVGTFVEGARKVPLIKHFGGNLFVKGRKKDSLNSMPSASLTSAHSAR